jgi:hypothetical protein
VTGQVRCFVPAMRRGIIQTDAGEVVSFCVAGEPVNLQGGDIVEFDPVPQNRAPVDRIVLRQRWVEKLNLEFRSLVNQFHMTIRFRS